MNKLLLLIMLLLPASAFAGDVCECEPDDITVPHRVSRYRTSVHTPAWSGDPENVINPDVSGLLGIVPRKYWKCAPGEPHPAGETILEMSAAEKSAMDALDPVPDPWESKTPLTGAQGDRPTCVQARRGTLWTTRRVGGQDDQCFLCIRKSGGTFVWAELTLIIP